MDLLYLASLSGGAITLALLPLLCLLDIRTRQVPDKLILFYLAVTLPALCMLYLNGLTIYYFVTSLVMIGVWLLMRYLKVWGGADTKFLMVFSLVVPLNPLNLYQTNFQTVMPGFLGLTMVITALIYYQKKWKVNECPMMIPISAAILLTMLTGAFL